MPSNDGTIKLVSKETAFIDGILWDIERPRQTIKDRQKKVYQNKDPMMNDIEILIDKFREDLLAIGEKYG